MFRLTAPPPLVPLTPLLHHYLVSLLQACALLPGQHREMYFLNRKRKERLFVLLSFIMREGSSRKIRGKWDGWDMVGEKKKRSCWADKRKKVLTNWVSFLLPLTCYPYHYAPANPPHLRVCLLLSPGPFLLCLLCACIPPFFIYSSVLFFVPGYIMSTSNRARGVFRARNTRIATSPISFHFTIWTELSGNGFRHHAWGNKAAFCTTVEHHVLCNFEEQLPPSKALRNPCQHLFA